MDIQVIGSRTYSVYIAGPELERRHLDPQGITARQAREIVRDLIGCDGTDTVSLELYPGRHEVLIFVRRSAGEPEFYVFYDLESLLEAIAACGREAASSLFFYNGTYILALWSDDGLRRGALCEFGEPLDLPGGFLPHLREHGRVIRDGDAAEALTEAFLEPRS